MNPTRDTAIWAASLLPAEAPQWVEGMAVFAGIIGALVAVVAPPCLAYAAIVNWKEGTSWRS